MSSSGDTTMGGVAKTKFTPKVGVQRQRKTLPATSALSAAPPSSARTSTARQMSPKKESARVSFAPHAAYKPPKTSSSPAASRSSQIKPRAAEVMNDALGGRDGRDEQQPDELRDELRDEQDNQQDALKYFTPIVLPFAPAPVGAGSGSGDISGELILFQLPTSLPMSLPSLSSSASVSAENLSRLPSGEVGHLRRHLSGRHTLIIGDIVYDVTDAVSCSSDQSVIHIDTAAATFVYAGSISARQNVSLNVADWTRRNAPDEDARADEFVIKQHSQQHSQHARIKQERT